MKKKIAILGSTGSIGKYTLDVIAGSKKNFDVVLLSANNNYKRLIRQAKKFKAKKGDIIAAEAKLPTGEGKVIDVIVWGRIMEIISSNDFLPNEATKELTEENINIMDTAVIF